MGSPRRCAAEGCVRSYKDHRWGKIHAYAEGWFMQKDDIAWCPDHVPEWVPGWRIGARSNDEQL